MAAKHFAALGVTKTEPEANSVHVDDYSQLPGGGAYEYTADGTFYVGEEPVGKWRLNEDKSFTKLTD